MPFLYGASLPEILLIVLASVIVMFAQSRVQGAYQKFSRMAANTRYTGADVARMILRRQGIDNVEVVMGQGVLSDHYNPKTKVVSLSPAIFNTNSIAAVSVAAHEVGHAIQHAHGYAFLAVRNTLLPLTVVAGNLAWGVILLGLFISPQIMWIGISMLGVVAVFQTVTLPIEFNASKRALNLLVDEGILSYDEQSYAKQMLSAAALTYVAALLATLFQILRLVLMNNRRR